MEEVREKAVKNRNVIGSLGREECVHGGKERLKE